MTQNDLEWRLELEESAQGVDLFEAPGSATLNSEAKETAKDWDSGSGDLDSPGTTNVVGAAVVGEARSKRLSLQAAMAGLEAATASASGADGWLELILEAVGRLRGALSAHVEVTEGEVGLLAEILQRTPRLATEIALIKAEHEELIDTLDKVDLTVRTSMEMDDPDPEPLRRRVMTLLGRLTLHRQRGADLVYDAYNVDIAAGD
jgi:hypothetical protein